MKQPSIPGLNKVSLAAIEQKANQTSTSSKISKRTSPKTRDFNYANIIEKINSNSEEDMKELADVQLSSSDSHDDASEANLVSNENQIVVKTVKFKSGTTADFYRVFIPFEDLESAIVVKKCNKRYQALLSVNNTHLLSKSLKEEGQLYDCYGQLLEDGKISNWDGSRRYFAAKSAGVGLWFLVTKRNDISESDKRSFFTKFHLYEPQSLVDKGYEYLELMQTEQYKQVEIAKLYKVSKAHVTAAIQSTEIPAIIIGLFPSTNDLTSRELIDLRKISKMIVEQHHDLTKFILDLDIKAGTSKKEVFDFLQESITSKATKDMNASQHNESEKWFSQLKLINKSSLQYNLKLNNLTDSKKAKLEEFLEELSKED